MNSDKHRPSGLRGNAMIYILLALALLAGLTMVLSRGASTGGDDLSADKVELLTTSTVAYVGSAKNVVDQMVMTGSTINNLDFSMPGDVSFDNAPHIHKVYHPQGGGFSYKEAQIPPFDSRTDPVPTGWYFLRNNVEWTPTAAPDVLFTAYLIDRSVCENLNKKITGSTDIPVVSPLVMYFVPDSYHGMGNAPLTEAVCPECEGYPSLCVDNGFGWYAYYNIIEAQ